MRTQHTKTYGKQQEQWWVKFVVINAYIKRKTSQTKNLVLYLKELEKQEQIKLIVSTRKEITKISVEIK